ncbi:hypothetical protein [Fodinicurvata sp. EGI_FJ10296]|uniref:hypothetical protein n=1 Tax=Fodinicurvata sp. EGI_FJ10296 TaxID=3231908 RepID=UPI003453EDF7
MTPDSDKFARLGRPFRVWAISAIHCDVARLTALHDHVWPLIRPGDRVVYLGNMIGRGPALFETIHELLTFRRALIALPGMLASDVVYLRGTQEEMWQKLLQLQFAPNPADVLTWMLDQGVAPTLRAYGGSPDNGLAAARDGAVQLTRWTNDLRQTMRHAPGHTSLFSALRRAAFDDSNTLLFVSAGLDPQRPLAAQGDSFWWGARGFSAITDPYEGFIRIVRGFDPNGGGIDVSEVTASLDGGAGTVICAKVESDGTVSDIMEV